MTEPQPMTADRLAELWAGDKTEKEVELLGEVSRLRATQPAESDGVIRQALLLAQEELQWDQEHGRTDYGAKRDVSQALRVVDSAVAACNAHAAGERARREGGKRSNEELRLVVNGKLIADVRFDGKVGISACILETSETATLSRWLAARTGGAK